MYLVKFSLEKTTYLKVKGKLRLNRKVLRSFTGEIDGLTWAEAYRNAREWTLRQHTGLYCRWRIKRGSLADIVSKTELFATAIVALKELREEVTEDCPATPRVQPLSGLNDCS